MTGSAEKRLETEMRAEGEVERREGIEFRSAGAKDAEGIAELYKKAYDGHYPLREYFEPGWIVNAIKKQSYIWQIAVNKNKVVGSSVGVPCNWNKSFEIGRTIITDNFYNRKIAKTLCERVRSEGFTQGFEIGWGTIRNEVMYNISKYLFMPVVGYLPGMHKPKVRETHLFCMRPSPIAKEKRRVPKQCPLYQSSTVKEITKELALDSIISDYPPDVVVGPNSDYAVLLKLSYHGGDNSTIINSIDNFDKLAAEYLQVTLLADKTDAIKFFSRLGFELCAFLPAWFEGDGKRYDCVTMASCGVKAVLPEKMFLSTVNKFKKIQLK